MALTDPRVEKLVQQARDHVEARYREIADVEPDIVEEQIQKDHALYAKLNLTLPTEAAPKLYTLTWRKQELVRTGHKKILRVVRAVITEKGEVLDVTESKRLV